MCRTRAAVRRWPISSPATSSAMFANLSDALGQAGAGTIRLLAVSSEKRARQLPDVPTVIEQGFPTFKTTTWNGLMATGRHAEGNHRAELLPRSRARRGTPTYVGAAGADRRRCDRRHAGGVRRHHRRRLRVLGRGGEGGRAGALSLVAGLAADGQPWLHVGYNVCARPIIPGKSKLKGNAVAMFYRFVAGFLHYCCNCFCRPPRRRRPIPTGRSA